MRAFNTQIPLNAGGPRRRRPVHFAAAAALALAPLAAPTEARAQAAALCADPNAACTSQIEESCLSRYGAGAIGTAEENDPCVEQWDRYSKCLGRVAAECDSVSTGGGGCDEQTALALWGDIKDTENPEELESLAKACPNTPVALLATTRARALRAAATTPEPAAPAPEIETKPEPVSTPAPVAPAPEPAPAPVYDKAFFEAAQSELKRIGLYPSTIDGDWGPGSRAAMREFQRRTGRPQTGEVDEAQLTALRAMPTPAAPTPAPAPATPAPEPARPQTATPVTPATPARPAAEAKPPSATVSNPALTRAPRILRLQRPPRGGSVRLPGGQQPVLIVGSSTGYPLLSVATQKFSPRPRLKSTGSGGGFKLFCAGAGASNPDITIAVRRISAREYAFCRSNGVARIVEGRLGYVAAALVRIRGTSRFTPRGDQLFRAIAAGGSRPGNWNQLSGAFPRIPVRVYGPKDNAVRGALEQGLGALCARAGLNRATCRRGDDLRTDIYRTTGSDLRTIRALQSDPQAFGIVSLETYGLNSHILEALPIDGVQPSTASVARGRYPFGLQVYFYFKPNNVARKRGIALVATELISDAAASPTGYLVRYGLTPLSPRDFTRNRAIVAGSRPLSPGSLR